MKILTYQICIREKEDFYGLIINCPNDEEGKVLKDLEKYLTEKYSNIFINNIDDTLDIYDKRLQSILNNIFKWANGNYFSFKLDRYALK